MLLVCLQAACVVVCLLASGCSKHTQARNTAPPPALAPATTAAPASTASTSNSRNTVNPNKTTQQSAPQNAGKSSDSLFTQTGMASWYGPQYHNHKAANGEVFDMNALSAAHRTLPLNSMVRVTNLANGKNVVVRITDRGPFYEDRILDLSKAAAKEIGTYTEGLSRVKIEVLEAPAPLDTGGRWAVQIGAFKDSVEASQLKLQLQRKYVNATVIQFHGPTGDWLRLRPVNDDRGKAFAVARATSTPAAGVFLVRLD